MDGGTGFNGRHLIIGFASGIEGEDVSTSPRPFVYSNFSLVGVCATYTKDSMLWRKLTGLNLASTADVVHLHDKLLEMFAGGHAPDGRWLRGVVRPTARCARADGRETVGRTIVNITPP